MKPTAVFVSLGICVLLLLFGLDMAFRRIRTLEALALAERRNVHELVETVKAMQDGGRVVRSNQLGAISPIIQQPPLNVHPQGFAPAVKLEESGYYYSAPEQKKAP